MQYKDAMEEEWEKFQKSIQQEEKVSTRHCITAQSSHQSWSHGILRKLFSVFGVIEMLFVAVWETEGETGSSSCLWFCKLQ